jgi:hypothetical protein
MRHSADCAGFVPSDPYQRVRIPPANVPSSVKVWKRYQASIAAIRPAFKTVFLLTKFRSEPRELGTEKHADQAYGITTTSAKRSAGLLRKLNAFGLSDSYVFVTSRRTITARSGSRSINDTALSPLDGCGSI